jgi:hypothetical protein
LETSIVVTTMLVFAVLIVWDNTNSKVSLKPALAERDDSLAAPQRWAALERERHRRSSARNSPHKASRSEAAKASSSLPNRAELERRAAMAEQEANHELNRLVGLLDLNESQQDQVFSLLVEKSPHFDPRFEVRGGAVLPPGLTNGSFETGLAALLDERQSWRFADEEANRRAWWSEIVESLIPEEELPQILPPTELSPASQAPSTPSTPTQPVPADSPPTKAVNRPTRLPID